MFVFAKGTIEHIHFIASFRFPSVFNLTKIPNVILLLFKLILNKEEILEKLKRKNFYLLNFCLKPKKN